MSTPRITAGDCRIFDEVVYLYDGTPEGLYSAIFAAYARKQDPSEVIPEDEFQPRLLQDAVRIPTDEGHALRVSQGIRKRLGARTQRQAQKCSLSGKDGAGTALYRFVRYALDEAAGKKGAPVNNISHPCVKPFFDAVRGVDNECEKIRQFARFQHLKGEGQEVWFARVNPRDAVIPLVMGHFVERFNIQPFILYDEVHGVAGVWDGQCTHLVRTSDEALTLPGPDATEAVMQDAWREFYRTLSVDARYNPELRRKMMPKRFWKNLTEMQDADPALRRRG